MLPFENIGKLLVYIGIFSIVLGVLLIFAAKVPGLGRLPGDIYIHKENFTFYFPVTTMIIISVILTVILNFIGR